MEDIIDYLKERCQEFDRHYNIATMLEARVDEHITGGEPQVEIRHINTIKSGLLVHLYNIVEAVATKTMDKVGQIVIAEEPGLWTDLVLHEWVRGEFWSADKHLNNGALRHLTEISGALVSGQKQDQFRVKGESGSWNDTVIEKIAKRFGCRLDIPKNIRCKAYEKKYRSESTALQYLANRRNDIAHGNTTFEEGVQDLTLKGVRELANRVLPFMNAVCVSYQKYLNNRDHLKKQEDAA